ncbi:MAG: S8 family serine peptidase [Methanobacteriota archaeon]
MHIVRFKSAVLAALILAPAILVAFPAAAAPVTGSTTLYLHSLTGIGNLDRQFVDGSFMDTSFPVFTDPAMYYSVPVVGSTNPSENNLASIFVDASWYWKPSDGFAFTDADITVTFWVRHTMGIVFNNGWNVRVYADTALVAERPGGGTFFRNSTDGLETQFNVTFEDVDATGSVLILQINPLFVNSDAGDLLLYDAVDYASRVDIDSGTTPPTDTTPPSAVTGLVASRMGGESILLTWNNNTTDNVGVAGFRVMRGPDPGNLSFVGNATGSHSMYLDRGLSASTTHVYSVAAFDAAGNFGAAATGSATTANSTRAHTVVAVIDTGTTPSHREFAENQFVAWWDFTDENGPFEAPNGSTWDTRSAPYDNNGHGTTTTARVGGRETGAFPGVALAMGKVGDAGGGIMNLNEAYDWAVNTVGADIVSISIGSIIPIPGGFDTMVDQIRAAHAKGVTTVVSAGNGYGNACVGPEMSWSVSYGHSRDAIAVGSLFGDGSESVLLTCSAWMPDVSAEGNDVRGACPASDDCYEQTGGTSFAAPFVAGAGARYLRAARDNGFDLGPRYLRSVIESCATDQGWTYTLQGNGMVDAVAIQRGVANASAGLTCGLLAGGVENEAPRDVSEQVSYFYAQAFTSTTAGVLQEVDAASTAPGTLGASTPVAMEVEVYDLGTLTKGSTAVIDVTWALDGVSDVDVYLIPTYALGAGPIRLGDHYAKSANNATLTESITFTAAWTESFKVVVVGWALAADTPITVTGAGAFDSQGRYAGQAVV